MSERWNEWLCEKYDRLYRGLPAAEQFRSFTRLQIVAERRRQAERQRSARRFAARKQLADSCKAA